MRYPTTIMVLTSDLRTDVLKIGPCALVHMSGHRIECNTLILEPQTLLTNTPPVGTLRWTWTKLVFRFRCARWRLGRWWRGEK